MGNTLKYGQEKGYQNVEDVREWIMNGCSFEDLRNYLGLMEIPKQRPVDVRIVWRGDELANFSKRVIKGRYGLNTRVKSEKNVRPPESQGHIRVKKEVVKYLRGIDIEAYPEVVFYENALSDFYEWQRKKLGSKSDADGIFGYGSVGFGNFKNKYGQQIRADVAGWIGNPNGGFNYPILAVEVMKSSNLREEILNLKKIHGSSAVYTVIVEVYGELYGTINNIPIVSLEGFEKGIPKRIELVRDAIIAGKSEQDIFKIGREFNAVKLP